MTSQIGFSGKTVVVTGAGKGIGEAIAKAFLQADAKVIAVTRKPIPWSADARASQLETVLCDVRTTDELRSWLHSFEESGGKANILVNNAGALHRGMLIDATADDFDASFSVNTRAMFLISQLFALHMKKIGGGVILNAASFAASIPSVGSGIYAASKASVVSLTRSMAAEWSTYGIRVNAFSPGVIRTTMTAPALDRDEARMLDAISLRRIGTPEEVASAVLFLASDAASYLTGIDLDVSGGKLAVQDPGAAGRK